MQAFKHDANTCRNHDALYGLLAKKVIEEGKKSFRKSYS